MSKLKLIQVGVGGFGKSWLRSIMQVSDVELVAAVDIIEGNLENARAVLRESGVPDIPMFQDYQEAFRSVPADAALIVTPPKTHMTVAFDALKSRLHILMEKPLTYSYEEAVSFYRSHEAYGKKVMINQNYRWMAIHQTIKRTLMEGLIGEVAYIDWNFRRTHAVADESWRVQATDFLFTDVSIHHFDLMRYLLAADPLSVQAHSMRPEWSGYEGKTVGGGSFEFPGGITAYYFGSMSDTGSQTPWNGNVRIIGSQGAIELNNDVPVLYIKGEMPRKLEITEQPFESKAFSLNDFAQAIREDRRPITDLKDNFRSYLMVQGLIDSTRQNKRIAFSDYLDKL